MLKVIFFVVGIIAFMYAGSLFSRGCRNGDLPSFSFGTLNCMVGLSLMALCYWDTGG